MRQTTEKVTRKGAPAPKKRAFEPRVGTRHWLDRVFLALVVVATSIGLVVLGALLVDVFVDGISWLDLQFITSFPSRVAEQAGIWSALVGSIWLLSVTTLIVVPLGVGAAVYLEEYAADNRLNRFIQINISNLAGVPSIIYGLLGLGIFVRVMQPITGGRTILSGALTLTLLVLPVIIIATREALRAVPDTVREAGYALGATKWEVVRSHVLPMALPGALTGTILALSRAIGETAPLVVIGALGYVAFIPYLGLQGLQSPFTALPVQIYNWVSRPQEEFQIGLTAAGIIVLMVVLLVMNSVAIFLRNRYQRRS